MSSIDQDLVAAALPAYEIGAELGRGAWGVVLAGRHRRLGRAVAIKQLPRAFSADPSVRQRFLAEARLLAGLDHPHIVPVYDYVEHEGLCLLVMEQLTGGTVAERHRRGGLDAPTACAIAIAGCAGLHHAHAQGVLHRDVKPENLLFADTGVVKVADFGIAKVLAGESSMATRSGEILGTPAYMAPEQALGEPLGPEADVYAIGSMLYELLAGRLPFSEKGGALEILFRHVHEEPRRLTEHDAPAPLAQAIMTCLARDPGERHGSAEDVAVAVGEAATASWGPGWLEGTGVPLIATGRILASVIDTAGQETTGYAAKASTPAEAPAAAEDGGSRADTPRERRAADTIVEQARAGAPDGGRPRRRAVMLSALMVALLGVAAVAVLVLGGDGATRDGAAPARTAVGTEESEPDGEADPNGTADAPAPPAEPEGTIVFVSDRTGSDDIFAIEPDGSGERNLTSSPSDDRQPNWSRERDRIVFASDRAGEFAIHTMAPDGSDVTQLTAGTGGDLDPVFSPGGERIAFSGHREDTRSIYVIDVDGTGIERITDDGGADMRPTWSPDGTRLAFHRVHGPEEQIDILVTEVAADAEAVNITDRPGRDFHPSWSPAEPLLVFASDRDSEDEDVFLRDTTGVLAGRQSGTARNVTRRADVADWDPNWSADGQWIAFESDRTGGTSDVYVIRPDGSDLRQVTDSPDTNGDPGW